MVNLGLLRRCHEYAIDNDPEGSTSFQRLTQILNSRIPSTRIQNEFHGEAYVAFLIGEIDLTELEACLEFDNKSQIDIFVGIVLNQYKPKKEIIETLRKLTRLPLTYENYVNLKELADGYLQSPRLIRRKTRVRRKSKHQGGAN